MVWGKVAAVFLVSWFVHLIFVVHIDVVQASINGTCTQNNTKNCTGNKFRCSDTGVCECVQGYLLDTDGLNCRLPNYNETCELSVGCQDSRFCTNVTGLMICQCENEEYYYDPSVDSCITKPGLGIGCTPSIGCEALLTCDGTPPTCQCNSSDVFFNSVFYQCTPLSDLAAKVLSTQSTDSSVTFYWVPVDVYTFGVYDIQRSPNDGNVDYSNEEGAMVSGLQSGTLYNFTLVAQIVGDQPGDLKKYYGPSLTAWTKVSYGGECDTNRTCQDTTTTCMEAVDKVDRCLCGKSSYNKTQDGECSPVNDLMVSDITHRSLDTQVTLNWTPAPINLTDIIYRIVWVPTDKGHVDRIASTGADVSGLSAGSYYIFFISAVVPEDGYNNEKITTAPEYIVQTDIPYLGDCTPNIDDQCLDMSQCLYSNNKKYRCMCSSSMFFIDRFGTCFNLSELAVSFLTALSFGSSVTLTWLQTMPYATYTIDWAPPGGTLNYTNDEGGQVVDLQPGIEYNFTVVSVLSADMYYPEKTYRGPSMTVWTESRYGEQCTSFNGCYRDLVCMVAIDNTTRCLCDNGFFNTTMDGDCIILEVLIVRNITSTSTDSTVDLYWTPSSIQAPTSYRVQWLPKGGHVDKISSVGAHVIGLAPGTEYYFSVTTEVLSDTYNNEKSVSGSEYLTKTDIPHGGACQPYTNEQCLDGTSCLLATDGKFRCLCSNVTYFNEVLLKCMNLSDLEVSAYPESSDTIIKFFWSASDPYGIGEYAVDWTPHDGFLDYLIIEGCQISNLQPGTEYNFSVVTMLTGYLYYPVKTFESPNVTIWTKAVHEGKCNTFAVCQDSSTSCVQTADTTDRCLCADNQYNKTQTGNCTSLEDLKLQDVHENTTATSIIFTWTSSNQPSTVTYSVVWTPRGGRLANLSDTGASVVDLTPGTVYTFTIISSLPSDSFYRQKEVSLQMSYETMVSEEDSEPDTVNPGVAAGVGTIVAVVVLAVLVVVYLKRGPVKARVQRCWERRGRTGITANDGYHGNEATASRESSRSAPSRDETAGESNQALESISLEDISTTARSIDYVKDGAEEDFESKENASES